MPRRRGADGRFLPAMGGGGLGKAPGNADDLIRQIDQLAKRDVVAPAGGGGANIDIGGVISTSLKWELEAAKAAWRINRKAGDLGGAIGLRIRNKWIAPKNGELNPDPNDQRNEHRETVSTLSTSLDRVLHVVPVTFTQGGKWVQCSYIRNITISASDDVGQIRIGIGNRTIIPPSSFATFGRNILATYNTAIGVGRVHKIRVNRVFPFHHIGVDKAGGNTSIFIDFDVIRISPMEFWRIIFENYDIVISAYFPNLPLTAIQYARILNAAPP